MPLQNQLKHAHPQKLRVFQMKTLFEPHPLVGQILEVEIEDVRYDTCFFSLPGGYSGRLKQEDSFLANETTPLSAWLQYSKGRKITVFLQHHKDEERQKIFFGHERWGHNNPWAIMDEMEWIMPGDVVTGKVSRTFESQKGTRYLVLLDTTHPVLSEKGYPFHWSADHPTLKNQVVLQPDIFVTFTDEDLPSADGSVDSKNQSRLSIQISDTIRLMMVDVEKRPPHHPDASLLRLINARDAMDADCYTGIATTNIASKRTRESVQHTSLTKPEPDYIANWRKQLKHKRILIVDDTFSAAEGLKSVLESYDACVDCITSPKDQPHWPVEKFTGAITKSLQQSHWDLILVDDGLPQIHAGETALINAIKSNTTSTTKDNIKEKPPIYLLSGFTEKTLNTPEYLKSLGINGTLRRPILINQLVLLLENQPKEIWEWEQHETSGTNSRPLNQLPNLLKRISETLHQDYSVLLEIDAEQRLHWVHGHGTVPFGAKELHSLLETTDIRVLIHTEENKIQIGPTGGKNPCHPHPGHVAHWYALATSTRKKAYLLGIGSKNGRELNNSLPWIITALTAELQNIAWETSWGQHASALASGWLVQGYAHESTTATERLIRHAEALRQTLGRTEAAGTSIGPKILSAWLGDLERQLSNTASMAQRILQRQRQREKPLNLQSCVDLLIPSLVKECSEHGVLLSKQPPPPVFIKIPEWVFSIALSNLVLNSIKHHYRQNNRWVKIGWSIQENPAKLTVSVEDNGPGLSMSARRQLFEPGISGATDPQQRHGIGLWLSKKLLSEHGAIVRLTSSYRGLGAIFEIEVPIIIA